MLLFENVENLVFVYVVRGENVVLARCFLCFIYISERIKVMLCVKKNVFRTSNMSIELNLLILMKKAVQKYMGVETFLKMDGFFFKFLKFYGSVLLNFRLIFLFFRKCCQIL